MRRRGSAVAVGVDVGQRSQVTNKSALRPCAPESLRQRVDVTRCLS